jgi:hypothetical protein
VSVVVRVVGGEVQRTVLTNDEAAVPKLGAAASRSLC